MPPPPRLLIAVFGFAGVLLVGGYAWNAGLLGFEPELVSTPEVIVLGERVFTPATNPSAA